MIPHAVRSHWQVIIPVKDFARAKSRLGPDDDPGQRARLAKAFALDTCAALVRVPSAREVILVVETADQQELFQRHFGANEAVTLTTIVQAEPRGLNEAVHQGAAACDITLHRAVLFADMPAITAAEIAQAFQAAEVTGMAAVADHEGKGTTFLAVPPGVQLVTFFGHSSFEQHQRAGYSALRLPQSSGIRRDVDTAEDLSQAIAMGVGAFTRDVIDAP